MRLIPAEIYLVRNCVEEKPELKKKKRFWSDLYVYSLVRFIVVAEK